MPSAECRGCGARVSKTYARVFGDQDDIFHSCSECSTQEAVASSAGASPSGTPRVHRPDESDPVPASLPEEDAEDLDTKTGPLLESVLQRDDQEKPSDEFTHEDQQFQQLVAEEPAD